MCVHLKNKISPPPSINTNHKPPTTNTPPPPTQAMTDAQVHARLAACGFAGGDLRAFKEAGGGILAPECVLHFLTRFPQVCIGLVFG